MASDWSPSTLAPRLGAAIVAALLGLTLAAVSAAGAHAASAPSSRTAAISLSAVGTGGGLLLEGAPGSVLRGAVRVQNLSGETVTVALQAADIRTGGNGSADYVTSALSQAGRWLSLGSPAATLAAHEQREIQFTLSVPAGESGSHYAGIVAVNQAELAPARQAHSAGIGGQISTVAREAIPITVRLPGAPTRSLALRSAKIAAGPFGAALMLGLLPGGNVLIQAAHVQLSVMRGSRTLFSYSGTLGQLFPGSSLDYRIPWVGTPTPGSYRVLGVVSAQGAAPLRLSRSISLS